MGELTSMMDTHAFMVEEGKLANSDWEKNLWKIIHNLCFSPGSFFSKLIVHSSKKHYNHQTLRYIKNHILLFRFCCENSE